MNRRIRELFYRAAEAATIDAGDCRHHRLGAVGVRSDGTLVTARNGSDMISPAILGKHQPNRRIHAEYRLLRKLDVGATVYVARISRATGEFAQAKPCAHCQKALRTKGVRRVYYTVDRETYQVWEP